jgi:hypothetical protein
MTRIMSDKLLCRNCNHECHCHTTKCDQYVGIGMSDKSETCGCLDCNCKSLFPDWG